MAKKRLTQTNGKGDRPRPVNKRTYDQNYDGIRWPSKRRVKGSKG